jgi:2-polyprenyl-3-methyl-5-hydroxy-6-metoxy-1,4-benzoquinol methylase
MPLLSELARKRKLDYFSVHIPKSARILAIGCGDGWVGRWLKSNGYPNYVGMDLVASESADIAGNIVDWRTLGIAPSSFDVIIAFEVIEHVACLQDCYDILRPGGLLMLTSPRPSMDWLCRILEILRLNQPRTSPHSNLTDFTTLPFFERLALTTPLHMVQWGIFRKPINP